MTPFKMSIVSQAIQPEPEDRDEREPSLRDAKNYAELLCGDVVLIPFNNGEPDWTGCTRSAVTPFAGHWSELQPCDAPRLAVLTDGFRRFDPDAPIGVSVLTLVRGGTPEIRQIDGCRWPRAEALVFDALVDHEPLRRAKRELEAANDNIPLPVINPAEWHGKPVPEREWFVEGLIPLRTVTLLSGDGGLGKSLLALQLGVAAATGSTCLDMEPTQGRVLYVGAEDEADEFHRRMDAILKNAGGSFADLGGSFLLVPLADRDAVLGAPDKAGHINPTPLMASLIEQVTAFDPVFIVLDTSADMFGGDEIKRAQVRQFVGMLRTIAITCDCAVLLLSHPSLDGMRSGSGTSGSTAWNNSVRSRLYLTAGEGQDADPDARLLTTKKANYGKTGGELKMRWQDGVFVLDDGKASPAAGLMRKRAEEVFINVLSIFTRTGQSVSDVSGTNYAPAKIAKHPESKGVSKRHLADAMQRLLDLGTIKIIVEGPESRPRKRLILTSDDYGGG
ncbi:AAA family ATPase [Aurantimonas sp. E1-2-R+4]|uniref:AAA family ATPase n=1 Tax=Aurantimonas sp. E1-2-R+4 TaxID=3113714 RepID=UPI002F94C2C7